MKALKEKRISLRSLWRRGLVILSLFALVFASCNDSGSGGGDSGGLRIVEIIVNAQPKADQYMGKPVDLTGMTLDVYWNNGTKTVVAWEDEKSNIVAFPRIFTGYYTTDWNQRFQGMNSCLIRYKGQETRAFLQGKAWGIVRTNTRDLETIDGTIWGIDPNHYNLGIRWTGKDSLKNEAFVDDDEFNFSGVTLEADYFYWDRVNQRLERDVKPLSLGDVTYKIMPSYDMKDSGDSTGYIEFTVGEDFNYFLPCYRADGVTPRAFCYPDGVTTSAALDTVHVVTSIELVDFAGFDDYYYWEPNDNVAWAARLAGAKLKVNYSGGQPFRTFPIEDLAYKQKIWWNAEASNSPWSNIPNTDWPNTRPWAWSDFDIVPIKYPLTIKKNDNPGITLYYRGATYFQKVDVLTKLEGINVVAKSGGDIDFDPAQASDNDIRKDLRGARGLADLITVTATYSAYNNSSVQNKKPLELTYLGYVQDRILRTGPGLEYIPYYTFDKGTEDDNTYNSAWEKWDAARAKGKLDVLPRAVTIGHHVRESDLFPNAAAGEGVYDELQYNPVTGVLNPGAVPYIFANRPFFNWNLIRDAATPSGIVYPAGMPAKYKDMVRGWVWVINNDASGIKQPPKAAVQKPIVNWLVK